MADTNKLMNSQGGVTSYSSTTTKYQNQLTIQAQFILAFDFSNTLTTS